MSRCSKPKRRLKQSHLPNPANACGHEKVQSAP